MKTDLKALSAGEIREFMAGMGLPAYRASQLMHWIYGRRAESLEDITEFSKNLRADLESACYISNIELLDRRVSEDGTEKFLFGLEDGLTVESVLIPADLKPTLCISSQVGCAMGCRFCLTGAEGLKRNLKAHEIADQVIAAARLVSPVEIGNLVLMGMGEPMQNLEQVVEALWRITGLMSISPRRITVSTSGVAERMLDFARKAPPVNLAVSLNAASDEVRNKIMPVNRKYPLRSLMEACRRYPLPPRRRITFEYVLIDGVNDSPEDAARLVSLLRGIRCKVNLIPLNEFEGSRLKRPPDEKTLAFQNVLTGAGLTATLRKSRGRDILAACGQLRARALASSGS